MAKNIYYNRVLSFLIYAIADGEFIHCVLGRNLFIVTVAHPIVFSKESEVRTGCSL